MNLTLPSYLSRKLNGYICEIVNIGMSTANVYLFKKNTKTLFLKTDRNIKKIKKERDVLEWLKNKLPVPQVIYYKEIDEVAYLLETAMPGVISCQNNIDKKTVRTLANGLLLTQSVDISECPFNNCLDNELEKALYKISHNNVDIHDFEINSPYKTPTELYKWLCQNRIEEEPCFVHGDYCLPNILINNEKLGFIDMGGAGIADKWKDIALCVRSLGYNLFLQNQSDQKNQLISYLFECLNIEPNWEKIDYYIKLDELS